MKLIYTLLLTCSLSLAIESRKVVVVMDTGIKSELPIKEYLCNFPNKDATGKGLQDLVGHGTNIAYTILSKMNPKTHCLHIVKWYNSEWDYQTPEGLTNLAKSYYIALEYIQAIRPSYLNMSLSGNAYSLREHYILSTIIEQGATIVVSAGNDGINLSTSCNIYPACHRLRSDRFKVVSSCGIDRVKHLFSNYGGPVNACANGFMVCAGGSCLTGTSQAAAVYTSTLIEADKWDI